MADLIGFQNVFFFSAVSIAVSFAFAFASKEFKETDLKRVSKKISLLKSIRGVKNRGLFLVSMVRMMRMIITMGVIMTVFPLFLNDERYGDRRSDGY